MFGYMYIVLNIDEKKLIAQFGWKPRDALNQKLIAQLGFKDSSRGFQASYVINFLISIRKPFPTSHKTSGVTPQNFSFTN
jgi:hypothetical protein